MWWRKLSRLKRTNDELLRKIPWFIMQGVLYRRGSLTPLLWCVIKDEAKTILSDIHEGSCGDHTGTDFDGEDSLLRVLLTNNQPRHNWLHEKMRYMPNVCEDTKSPIYRAYANRQPIIVCDLWNWYNQCAINVEGRSTVCHRSYGLLHKVSWIETADHDHYKEIDRLCGEEHHM